MTAVSAITIRRSGMCSDGSGEPWLKRDYSDAKIYSYHLYRGEEPHHRVMNTRDI
jgi:hypothetical protein